MSASVDESSVSSDCPLEVVAKRGLQRWWRFELVISLTSISGKVPFSDVPPVPILRQIDGRMPDRPRNPHLGHRKEVPSSCEAVKGD
jgi:hypothetical protein